MWQQYNAYNHADTSQELQIILKSNIRMEEKCDLGDFIHGMVVGERWAGLSILETTDLLRFPHT